MCLPKTINKLSRAFTMENSFYCLFFFDLKSLNRNMFTNKKAYVYQQSFTISLLAIKNTCLPAIIDKLWLAFIVFQALPTACSSLLLKIFIFGKTKSKLTLFWCVLNQRLYER